MKERFRRKIFAITASAVALFLSSCQSYQVPITYAEPATVKPGPHTVDLGRFIDERDDKGTKLGSIKNEVGIPIKELTTRKPVAQLVHNAVGYGLKARGMLVDKGRGRYVLGGRVKEFYVHQLASQEAGCVIQFELFRRGSSRPALVKTYRSQRNRRTPKVSYFGDVDEVANVASAALQDVIDQLLEDPAFRSKLR